MPKQVDHDDRRRELAEAAFRVVARTGVDGASLRLVSQEAGWSIGSMRHYFATRSELLAFALRHAAHRIEDRIAALPAEHTPLEHLREVAAELLPLDAARREEAQVYVAFLARATVAPDLAPMAGETWRRLHEPLVRHVAAAIRSGERAGDLDPEREASRLHALIDGLTLHVLTAPGNAPPELARAAVEDHLTALQATAGRHPSRRRRRRAQTTERLHEVPGTSLTPPATRRT